MQEQDEYQQARRRAEARVSFYIHLAIYLIVNAILVAVNLITSPEYLWFFWPLFGWGIGVLFHGLGVFALSPGAPFRERMIEREMERERTKRR